MANNGFDLTRFDRRSSLTRLDRRSGMGLQILTLELSAAEAPVASMLGRRHVFPLAPGPEVRQVRDVDDEEWADYSCSLALWPRVTSSVYSGGSVTGVAVSERSIMRDDQRLAASRAPFQCP